MDSLIAVGAPLNTNTALLLQESRTVFPLPSELTIMGAHTIFSRVFKLGDLGLPSPSRVHKGAPQVTDLLKIMHK